MNFWKSIVGMVQVELSGADPSASISAMNQAGFSLFYLESIDIFTVTFWINRSTFSKLKAFAVKRGEQLTIKKKAGLYWTAKRVKERPLFVFGTVLMLSLALFLPSRILFVHVEGNREIPTRVVLDQAEQCGIRFGASRRAVRSEQMKNSLLSAIPELQWAGVNTFGCTAVISVRERSESELSDGQRYGVSRIVALRDGVVTQSTVTRGTSLCKVGQAVTEGETLVSGYTDCGLVIRAERAEAEIFGLTSRNLQAVTPLQYLYQGDISSVKKKYSLIIGKKRIKFFKDSGISGTTCDKMYEEYSVTLPGGFQLPVKLSVETCVQRDMKDAVISEDDAEALLRDYSQRYLCSQMIAGQILRREETTFSEAGMIGLTGEYICHELIGQEQSEEIMDSYEQTD